VYRFYLVIDMEVLDAIRTAKRCREIIDPIGQLPAFLDRLRRAEVDAKSRSTHG
jgi:hypothetical protein